MAHNVKITLPTELVWHMAAEELPEHENVCIVITKTKAGVFGWNRAYYSNGYWHGSGSMSGVMAWAEFNITEEEIDEYMA